MILQAYMSTMAKSAGSRSGFVVISGGLIGDSRSDR